MKPGQARARVQETPDVCHKTPEQFPVSEELHGELSWGLAAPPAPSQCRSLIVITRQPLTNNYFWIGSCGCVTVQGGMVRFTGFPQMNNWTSRITKCLPECTKFEKRTQTYFGDLKGMDKVTFSSVCTKNGIHASVKIAGVNVPLN